MAPITDRPEGARGQDERCFIRDGWAMNTRNGHVALWVKAEWKRGTAMILEQQ